MRAMLVADDSGVTGGGRAYEARSGANGVRAVRAKVSKENRENVTVPKVHVGLGETSDVSVGGARANGSLS
jgi:hypothetical protein